MTLMSAFFVKSFMYLISTVAYGISNNDLLPMAGFTMFYHQFVLAQLLIQRRYCRILQLAFASYKYLCV